MKINRTKVFQEFLWIDRVAIVIIKMDTPMDTYGEDSVPSSAKVDASEKGSSQKSTNSQHLHYGFDNSNDSEHEILREEFNISRESNPSPIFPRKKLSGSK
ncbi:hypothetical protein SK128_020226 [Halocaridina rubra]|uniref:Uncharacterized protein n=1 Tax=Halocaridina rubra TaxID=373956 RepID=A0AAN8ZWN3_HALRR